MSLLKEPLKFKVEVYSYGCNKYLVRAIMSQPPLPNGEESEIIELGSLCVHYKSTRQSEIYNLGVRGDVKRNGVATALLQAVKEKYGDFRLWVDAGNEPAKALYNKFGMKRETKQDSNAIIWMSTNPIQ